MSALDIFNDDAFSVITLTAAVNQQPHVPGAIGKSKLFTAKGINTVDVAIELKDGSLMLVPASQRGATGATSGKSGRTMRSFRTLHLPQRDTILAASIQGLRAFGEDSTTQAVSDYVTERAGELAVNLEATIEYQRMGAIQGKVLDADGSTVLFDMYSEFGVVQKKTEFAFSVEDTNIRALCVAAKRQSEAALGAASTTGYIAYCSDSFFDALVDHPVTKAAYERWASGEALREDVRDGFRFAGIMFVNYRGSVGSTPFIADGEAYLVPEGVPGLFRTWFAPADYMETANTMGLPVYAKQWPTEGNKGVMLEVQSNPLSICTRPASVIKLKAK